MNILLDKFTNENPDCNSYTDSDKRFMMPELLPVEPASRSKKLLMENTEDGQANKKYKNLHT